MSKPAWPATLPRLMTTDGFNVGLSDGRLKTQMDSGHFKTRRRSSSIPKPISGKLIVTLEQSFIFESFWKGDLRGGVLPFWFPDQLRDSRALETDAGDLLLTDDGESILIEAWSLVKFGEAPQFNAIGLGRFQASVDLFVMP